MPDVIMSGGCAPRRARAAIIPKEKWEAMKPEIEGLYLKLPLDSNCGKKSLMEEMQTLHGFSATLKQYKLQIAAWGLDKKNVKKHEMKHIVRKKLVRQLRDHKDSSFRLHGVEVPDEKIERFMDRHNIPNDQEYTPLSPCAATPAAITVETPGPINEDWDEMPIVEEESILPSIEENGEDLAGQLQNERSSSIQLDDTNAVARASVIATHPIGLSVQLTSREGRLVVEGRVYSKGPLAPLRTPPEFSKLKYDREVALAERIARPVLYHSMTDTDAWSSLIQGMSDFLESLETCR